MSFQGDVGGIGLGELLQSLARSNREGVLTLNGRGGLVSTLGMQGGLLFLLPNRDEDGEIWRDRARRAWAGDPDIRVDSLRMSEIARAHRVEILYKLMDTDDGVHFRFEPGALPKPGKQTVAISAAGGEAQKPVTPSVHCEGASVEFLLLEYARISDESGGVNFDLLPSRHAVPRALDQGTAPKEYARLFAQCDGASSIEEIADRLAMPYRQALLMLNALFQARAIRFAQARELLVLFEKELGRGRFSRAASRVSAWCEFASPGPITSEDAMLIGKEWDTTRLPAMLHSMRACDARILMRRLDLAIQDAYTSVVHWTEMSRIFTEDPITELRLLAWKHKDTGDPESPSVREFLDMARKYRDQGHPQRAAVLLRLAAARLPNTIGERLELGTGLLVAGFIEEAHPWIIEASRTLIEEGGSEKAIGPLRMAVEASPDNRELRRLLSQARARSARGRAIRRNSIIALTIAVILGTVAVVQIRADHQRANRIAEISNRLNEPLEAIRLLEEYFPATQDPEILRLRNTIKERSRTIENSLRTAWYESYREAQLEATLGDPLLGLKRALNLPAPPNLTHSTEPFPLVSDLFNGLAARLETEISELGPPTEDNPAQVHTEQRQASLVDEILAFTKDQARTGSLDSFDKRLKAILTTIVKRGEERARAREERLHNEKVTAQDLMLGAARAHSKAGDWPRAAEAYQRLIESDPENRDRLEKLFRDEVLEVRAKAKAVDKARALAAEGKHDEAKTVLLEYFEDSLQRYALPWKITSYPSGARVKLSDGTVRTTPFAMESAFGEQLEIRVESDGCETYVLEFEEPHDRTLFLSREPELFWKTAHKVEAIPVSTGPDHILADRDGNIVRLKADGEIAWRKEVETLGGVARSPVFLPQRTGHLLLLTEDGGAWIIDAQDGELEGPWSTKSPPISGPVSTARGVAAHFANGRMLLWQEHPKAKKVSEDEAALLMSAREIEQNRLGSKSGLAALRRKERQGETRLDSPWTSWTCELVEDKLFVKRRDSGDEGFVILLSGEWEYLAWQAPFGSLPSGRLWVSDGRGLRSFVMD